MKIRIDGRELVVKKTTRSLIEWQRQSGLDMSTMTRAETAAYGAAMAAFCALHNAGFTPSWEELMDRDVDDFDLVDEPGDARTTGDTTPDPLTPLAVSDPADAQGEWPPTVD